MRAMKRVKTRFAPSPTGLLHIGNVRTALFNFLYAKKEKGKFLLRIEDTDKERSRTEYVESLMEDLRWLGMEWDEGPTFATGPADYFQSRRGDIYRHYYDLLEQQGFAYPCFCPPRELELSRKAQMDAGRPPRYLGRCSHLSAAEVADKLAQGVHPTLRFRIESGRVVEFDDLVRGRQRFNTSDIGDFIIRRADGTPAFFFCNAIDDALMEVSHVLRGEDHLTNTPRQILLLRALELHVPEYGHFSLILGSDGAPLSKRNGSMSVREVREQGYLPMAVVNLLFRLGHYYESSEIASPERLAQDFSLSSLGKSPARFDLSQLKHWQSEVVRNADHQTLWNWLPAKARVLVPKALCSEFLEVVHSNCTFPADAAAWAEIFFTDRVPRDETVAAVVSGAGGIFFRCALDALTRSPDDVKTFLDDLKHHSGAKGKELFQPLRASLTGRLDGPEIGKIFRLLDKSRMEKRLAEFVYQ